MARTMPQTEPQEMKIGVGATMPSSL